MCTSIVDGRVFSFVPWIVPLLVGRLVPSSTEVGVLLLLGRLMWVTLLDKLLGWLWSGLLCDVWSAWRKVDLVGYFVAAPLPGMFSLSAA